MGKVNINNLKKPINFGSGDNSTEIRVDGTQRLQGKSTAWKDMVMDLIGKKLTVNQGKVDYDFNEMAMKFQGNGSTNNINDMVGGNLEINHEFHIGYQKVFKPHIHWFQEVVSGTPQKFTLTMLWRLQGNNEAKNVDWVEDSLETGIGGADVFDFSGMEDGSYNQITRFPDMVVNCSISDTFQIKLVRTDTHNGNMFVYFFDIHGEVDGFGSDDELSKAE